MYEELAVRLSDVLKPGVSGDVLREGALGVVEGGDVKFRVGGEGDVAVLRRVQSENRGEKKEEAERGRTLIVTTSQCSIASMLGQLCADPIA